MWKGDFRIIDIIIHDKPYNDGYNNLTYSEIFDFTDFSEDDISCYEDSLYSTNIEGYKHAEIIGHPVMLGDVMEYFYGSVRFSEWGKCWRKLTKPIEEQSDDCIDFIYNLICK